MTLFKLNTDIRRKIVRILYSWKAIGMSYFLLVAVLLVLSGCSTMISTTVGDTTYSSSISLQKYERPNYE